MTTSYYVTDKNNLAAWCGPPEGRERMTREEINKATDVIVDCCTLCNLATHEQSEVGFIALILKHILQTPICKDGGNILDFMSNIELEDEDED